MNTYVSTQKFVRMTPRKLRLIADSVRKLKPAEAIEVLPFSPRFAAEPMLKVVQSAVANARQAGADETKLVFSEIMISEGPALKRGYQVSRGQWHPFKKRMSHIRVVLVEQEDKKKQKKEAVAESSEAASESPVVKKAAAPKKTVKTTKKK